MHSDLTKIVRTLTDTSSTTIAQITSHAYLKDIRDYLDSIQYFLLGIDWVPDDYPSYLDLPWFNFWWTFNELTLSEWVQAQADEIIAKVDPYSEQNIEETESAIQNVNDNTFVGTFSRAPEVFDSYKSIISDSASNPTGHFYIQTTGYHGVYDIPSSLIDINLTWFEPYRSQVHNIIRIFVTLGYGLLLLRALPSILGGSSVFMGHPETVEEPDVNVTNFYDVDREGVTHLRQSVTRTNYEGVTEVFRRRYK